MAQPSTAWREKIAADEDQRFAAYGEAMAEVQRGRDRRQGPGRGLHRKQLLGLAATLEVLGKLPDPARHGLFARAGRYQALVRLSNGGPDRAPDKRPDVRGLAIKVLGVDGAAALGGGRTDCQDFTLINHPAFAFSGPDPFVALVVAAAKGPASLLRHLVSRHGLLGAAREARRMAATFGKPFSGFATEPFFTAAPIACGPYAARVRLRPVDAVPAAHRPSEWADDVRRRLADGPLRWDLQLQFYTDETVTPIEDASVDWPEAHAPYVTVARLTIEPSALQAADPAFQQRIEQEVFDPWRALIEHRPLGAVMRARKVVYWVSQQQRAKATAAAA